MSAGWTRHCSSTAANSLSVTSSVSTRHVNSHKILFSLVCYNRPKVSLQGLRGLALLPAEPSDDNPQILFQAMTDNGALSCTAATGQGGIFLQPCRGFSIIPRIEKMSEIWLKIVTLSHKLLPLLHKGQLFKKNERKSWAPPSLPQPINGYVLKTAELHQMGIYVHSTNEAI